MAQTKKLLNPRGYLSHTQIDMYLRSPDLYFRRYILGEEQQENNAMTFGKEIADAMEKGESDDPLKDMLTKLFPRRKYQEYEIKVPFKSQHGEVVLLGKIDNFDDDPLGFDDDKTGVQKWTQYRAENHKQLHHYQSLIYLKYGKLAEDIKLNWAQTTRENGETELTGHIEVFKIKIALQEVLSYLSVAGRVALEIDAMYRKHLKSLT